MKARRTCAEQLVERKIMIRVISLGIAAGLLVTAAVLAACNSGSALYIS